MTGSGPESVNLASRLLSKAMSSTSTSDPGGVRSGAAAVIRPTAADTDQIRSGTEHQTQNRFLQVLKAVNLDNAATVADVAWSEISSEPVMTSSSCKNAFSLSFRSFRCMIPSRKP